MSMTALQTAAPKQPDLAAVKTRQQSAWSSGDYAVVGTIGLANWTPDGFIGQLFKTLGKHLPPPAGVKSPALWGTQARLDDMFGAHASKIHAAPRMFVFRYRSTRHWLDVFKTFYGP